MLSALVNPALDSAQALCASKEYDPDLWYSEDKRQIAYAKAICGSCPLKEACLESAVQRGELWGIYGGHTAQEIRQDASERMANPTFRSDRGDQGRRYELWMRGLADALIAKEMGTTTNAIQKWRDRNGFPCNGRTRTRKSRLENAS